MARLATSGAELKEISTSGVATDPDGLPNSATNVVIETSIVRSGLASWKVAPSTSVQTYVDFSFSGATGVHYYARVCMRIQQQADVPANNTRILTFADVSNSVLGAAMISSSDATGYILTDLGGVQTSAVIPYGAWARVEIHLMINAAAGTDDTFETSLDGVIFQSTTARNISTAAPAHCSFGLGGVASGGPAPGTSKIGYFDDFALNDGNGADQNTWPGDGRVVLLVPTADSAVGTGWTLGTGTAISAGSGSTAVKNKPPVGVADLAVGSDPKQIRNATSNANSSYDATMTTYTAAGVGPSDIINVIVPIVSTAAPVTTSSKQGTVGVVSNPAITNIALGAGGTAGAFWSGSAGGTFPTGWKWSYGTATYGSAVTKGTAPVMRITQVTSSTRIAVVCFMGIYVDYAPFGSDVTEACLSRRSTSRRGVRTVKV